MKRIDFPITACPVCGADKPRRRFRSGKLQSPTQYAATATCGKLSCKARQAERTKAEAWAAIGVRPEPGPDECSRCGQPCNLAQSVDAVGRPPTRCEICREHGGGRRVSYLRGPNERARRVHRAAALEDGLIAAIPFEAALHEAIVKMRRSAGLVQAEVARRMGLSHKTVSSWETGARLHTLGMAQLVALCRACGSDVLTFLRDLVTLMSGDAEPATLDSSPLTAPADGVIFPPL